LYITFSNGDDYVEEFSSSGASGVNTDYGPLPSTTLYTHNPNGIAIDSHGNIYVDNDGSNTISEFASNGSYIGIFASGLNQPAAMAFDSSGNLYVVNAGNSSIVKITPSGSSSVFVSSGLTNPQGIAVGPNGNIYVSDQSPNAIFEITPGGQMSTFYQDGSYTIVRQVEGLAFDANGNLYVASYRTNSIEKISPAGMATLFASNPTSNPEGISSPIGLAFDSSGDLFVANYVYSGTTYIDELSSTGALINAFTGNPGLPGSDSDLRDACYIAIANVVAGPAPDKLQVTSTTSFTSTGVVNGPFTPISGNYVVTDASPSSLQWTASANQSWLTLSATSGTVASSGSTTVAASINGNANALGAGTYTGNITFTDTGTGYTQTEVVTLIVNAPPGVSTPVFGNPLSVIAYSGAAFSFQLAATNNPAGYTATGLPAGLSFNSVTGLISGTATTLGQSVVNISAVNASGTTSTTLVLTVSPAATWGFMPEAPPNVVTVTSTNRNNVFYVGSPIELRLTNPSAAVTYEIRDYWGNMVEQGPAEEFIYPQVTNPGWYKIYIRGSQYQAPWGSYVGASTFVIWRNNLNFPPVPPLGTWGGSGLDDGVIRGVAAIGPDRHQVNASDVPDTITDVGQAVAVDDQYYTPFDPIRPRELLCSFGAGTSPLSGVSQIVTAFQGTVEYWEPRNEPQNTDPETYITNELIPFYNTVKGINPSLKVLGPAVVSIGPPVQQWVQDFFADGGANYIDGFSFHAYNNVNGDLWLTRQTMSFLDSVLAPYPKLERWQTEQGYDAALFGSYQPRLQGRWTMLQMMVFEQHGIPKEHNHLWYDINGGFWDAPTWWENSDGTLNPGAALMRVWSEELFGTTFTSAFDFGNPGNKLYVGDLFQGSGKKVAAFITAGSPCETIQLTDTGDASVNIVSPFGAEQTMPVQGGQFTLPISEIPTYVEFSGTLGVVPINSGSDIALMPGTTAAASGDGLYPPDPTVPNGITKIIDGVLENWYWTQTPATHPWEDDTPQFPAWVQINFPSPQTINNVVIYAGVPWQLDGTLVDYDLQYNKNGQWITLGTVTEPTNSFQAYWPANQTQVDSFFSDHWIFQHSFAPVTTQSIRLWVRNTTWGGGATQLIAEYGGQTGPHNICLREVEVYNTPTPTNETPNQPPVASGTSVVTAFETPVNVPVLNDANDPDNGPEPLHVQCVGAASDGIVSIVGNDVRYNPRPGYSGTDAFTYTVSDGLATATATVNVTVTPQPVSQYAPLSGLLGLVGQYYGTQHLTDPVITRLDGNINFNWGFGAPAPSMATTNYSVMWSGTVVPAYSENYTFYTLTSDGCRLWVNNQLLVNDWVGQPATQESWSIPLQAGQQYPIVMEYFSNTADSVCTLSWASPSTPEEIIPQLPSVPPLVTGGLSMVLGQYYGTTNFTDLLDTRYDPSIDFNWSSAAPFPNMNQTNFSVKWTGQILAQYSAPYTFYTTSDDGVRLYINGNLIINDWSSHSATVDTATVQLQAGQDYSMEMDYYQLTGAAIARLQWSCPSQPLSDILQIPEQAWTLANFSTAQLAQPSVSGSLGDADGDGLPNLLKYAFDINPLTSAGSSGQPALTFFSENGHDYMALVYRRNSAVTDLIYDLQVSTTLTPASWTTVDSPEEVLGQDPATGDLFIRRSVDITGMPVEFMRLNIW
jgi:sugar lactone lactonase YvrE